MQLTNSHLFDRKAPFTWMKRTADRVPKGHPHLLTILKGVMFALVVMGTHALHAQDTLQLVRSFVRHDPQLSYFKSATIPDSARMGNALAAIGDIDQDGIPDMAYGISYDSLGISANGRGSVMVHFMNADATIKSSKKITSNTDAFTVTLDPGDGFGARVAGIGDLNGDGYRDIAVLTTGDDDGGSNRGAVYILFLDDTAEVLSYQKISDTAGGFTGTMTGGNTFNGCLANLGDLNGDGIIDIGVGAFLSNDGGTGRGALWVLLMNTDGTVNGYRKYSASSTWPGGNPLTANNINFGFACVGLGDMDGDGVNDIAITARIQGNGRIYMMRLNSDGTIKNYNTIGPPSYGGLTTSVTNNGGHFGWSLANAGDLNGDGVVDLLAGMRMQADGYTSAGAVLAIYLKSNGTVHDEEKISQTAGTGGTALGLHANAWFGFQVVALGDLDGDHVLDIAVGSSGYDASGGDCTGSVYVLNLNPKPFIASVAASPVTNTGAGSILVTAVGGVRPYETLWNGFPDRDTYRSLLDTLGLDSTSIPYDTLFAKCTPDAGMLETGAYEVTLMDKQGTQIKNALVVPLEYEYDTIIGWANSGDTLYTKTDPTINFGTIHMDHAFDYKDDVRVSFRLDPTKVVQVMFAHDSILFPYALYEVNSYGNGLGSIFKRTDVISGNQTIMLDELTSTTVFSVVVENGVIHFFQDDLEKARFRMPKNVSLHPMILSQIQGAWVRDLRMNIPSLSSSRQRPIRAIVTQQPDCEGGQATVDLALPNTAFTALPDLLFTLFFPPPVPFTTLGDEPTFITGHTGIHHFGITSPSHPGSLDGVFLVGNKIDWGEHVNTAASAPPWENTLFRTGPSSTTGNAASHNEGPEENEDFVAYRVSMLNHACMALAPGFQYGISRLRFQDLMDGTTGPNLIHLIMNGNHVAVIEHEGATRFFAVNHGDVVIASRSGTTFHLKVIRNTTIVHSSSISGAFVDPTTPYRIEATLTCPNSFLKDVVTSFKCSSPPLALLQDELGPGYHRVIQGKVAFGYYDEYDGGQAEVRIFSMTGEMEMSTYVTLDHMHGYNEVSIDVSNLETGFYWMQVLDVKLMKKYLRLQVVND